MKNLLKKFCRSNVEALNLMKAGKVAGSCGVTSALLKVCKNNSVKKLAEVADELLQGKKCLKAGERAFDTNLQ